MTNLTNTDRLALLNTYRAADGKAPFADWRAGRHAPMLDAYVAAESRAIGMAGFEATVDELAQQEGRPSTEEDADVSAAIQDAGDADEVETETETETEIAAEEAKGEKAPSYKDFANYDRSRIMKPVEFVHSFLDAHPDLTRKAAVQALVEGGVNYSTARTQYQRWFAKRKG